MGVVSLEAITAKPGGNWVTLSPWLIHKAIGDQLTCIFVDTGLLRLAEGDQVMETFARHLGVKVDRVNAADDYYQALAGVSDPEQKRKIIGRLFVEITSAGMRESHVHDVQITKEAPNYQID